MARKDAFRKIKTELKQALEIKGIVLDNKLTLKEFSGKITAHPFTGLVSGIHTRADLVARFGAIN